MGNTVIDLWVYIVISGLFYGMICLFDKDITLKDFAKSLPILVTISVVSFPLILLSN